MIKSTSFKQDDINESHDDLFKLAKITIKLADVKRAPHYPNGENEDDVRHSYHLALSASELAVKYYPELDVGLISQFSLVHDMAEAYAGDTWTLNISEENRAKKELAESKAIVKLMNELPPHTAELLNRYEKQIEPEARFVRFVDKVLPEIINNLAGDANTYRMDHSIDSKEKMKQIQTRLNERYELMFPEFEAIHLIRQQIIKTFTKHIFEK